MRDAERQTDMRARWAAVLFAFCFLLAPTPAQPGRPTYDSLEWMAADSALIVEGHIVSIEPMPPDESDYHSRDFPWHAATFQPEDTLYGPKTPLVRFAFQAASYPDEGPLKRWQNARSPLLVFLCESRRLGNRMAGRFKYALRGPWNRSIVDLTPGALASLKGPMAANPFAEPAPLTTMAFERLTDPADVLARTRAAVAATGGRPVRSAFVGDVRMPIDSRLEALAREWLSSKERRVIGLEAIAFFKSPENLALVRKAFDDSSTVLYNLATASNKSLPVREVREKAKDVLDEWGVGWEPRTPPAAESEMVPIPVGPFLSGVPGRLRRSTLPAFWIGKTDVTVCQFRAFCQATGYVFDWSGRRPTLGWQDDHPMANVTWDEARSYCRWAGGDLPSMAQWEKAGRGTDGRTFPWGNKFDTSKMQMWQSSFGGYHETARVGAFPSGASPYGCLDMEGNVAQWCLDLPVAGETPPNFPPGVRRAIEGCGYDTSDSAEARIGTIAFWWPDSPMETYGFRIAASHRLTLPMLRRDPDAAISEPLPDPTPPAWPSARLSPDADYDGRRVLAARGKDVLLWDTETGKLLRRFTGHTTAVTAVAFERDGRHILTGSDGGTAPVRVWEIATGHVTMRFPSLDGTIRSLELSPKADEFLANEFKDGGRSPDHGRLMDATFGNEMFATPGGQARYSPDGTAILDVDREGFWVALWDVETFKEIFRVEPLANVYDAVTADVASWGDRLAVSFQGTVTIWDFRDHKKLFEIGGPQDRLYLARFTSNGDRLVATGRRGEIRVYDAESGKAVRLIKGPERVDDLLLSPDGARCLAKWEAGASLWDLESGKELARFARSDSIVGFAPDSKTLFAVSKDGRGVVVDATTGKRIRTVMLR